MRLRSMPPLCCNWVRAQVAEDPPSSPDLSASSTLDTSTIEPDSVPEMSVQQHLNILLGPILVTTAGDFSITCSSADNMVVA